MFVCDRVRITPAQMTISLAFNQTGSFPQLIQGGEVYSSRGTGDRAEILQKPIYSQTPIFYTQLNSLVFKKKEKENAAP